MSHVVVLGSINTDLVLRVPRLPRPGETVLGSDLLQTGGGKGANQAVAAARAGTSPVTFVSAVGDDDFGQQSLLRLSIERLRLDFVKRVAGVLSGVALIVVDDRGENSIAVSPGANAYLSADDINGLPDELFQSRGVLLASLEVPLAAVEASLRRARAAGMTTMLNPAPTTDAIAVRQLLPLVDVLTPNETEAAALAGVRLTANDEEDCLAIARALLGDGASSVVITRGKQGCVVATGERYETISACDVMAVDTTAAGDAFNGALAVALTERRALIDAARWATAAAAIAVTRTGAQPSLPTRAEIDAMLRQCVTGG